jgi:4-aminobutyrate--pyruvate transaminase
VPAAGLIAGLEIVADKQAKRPFRAGQGVAAQAAKFCEEEGLILRAMGDTIAICPRLIIQGGEINEMFDLLERALARTEAWVAKERLREAA